MREEFFDKFGPPERAIHKSISLSESEWRLVEAYQLYGASRKGYNIPIQGILREILSSHLEKDRSFNRDKDKWLKKLSEVEVTAEGACKE